MGKQSELVSVDRLTRKVGGTGDFSGDKRWKISATQIRAFSECPRKWGFRYIDGIQTPQGKAAALGSEVHSILEAWLKDGTPPPDTRAGKIARAGLEFLPEPGEADGVEDQILFDWGGLLFRGFVDAVHVRECAACGGSGVSSKGSACHPCDGAGRVPRVMDHKTSSDPKKWGLTAASLPTDVQGLVYAVHALDTTMAPVVDLRWTYFRTRGSLMAFPVDARITREDAKRNFETHVEPIGRSIVAAMEDHKANGTTAQSLPANPSACGMYGGCHFAEFCIRTTDETLTAIFGTEKEKEKEMGLKELLAQKRKKAAPPRVQDLPNHPDNNDLQRRSPGPAINSPEAPASDEVHREVSKVVGRITGNAKTRKAKARTVAEAAAGSTDPEETREAAEAVLDEVEVPKLSKSQQVVMDLLDAAGGCGTFSKTKARAAHPDGGLPFVHGRTLNAMVKAGLITVEDGATHPQERTVTKVETKPAPMTGGLEPSSSPHAGPPAPIAGEIRTAAAKVDSPEHAKGMEHAARVVESLPEPPLTTDAPVWPTDPVEFRPAPSDREVFLTILMGCLGDEEKANAMMDAYVRRFR